MMQIDRRRVVVVEPVCKVVKLKPAVAAGAAVGR